MLNHLARQARKPTAYRERDPDGLLETRRPWIQGTHRYCGAHERLSGRKSQRERNPIPLNRPQEVTPCRAPQQQGCQLVRRHGTQQLMSLSYEYPTRT